MTDHSRELGDIGIEIHDLNQYFMPLVTEITKLRLALDVRNVLTIAHRQSDLKEDVMLLPEAIYNEYKKQASHAGKVYDDARRAELEAQGLQVVA